MFIATSVSPLLLVAGYFLPSILALLRKHKNLTRVFVWNTLVGWTGIGYLAVLVYAWLGGE